MGEINRQQIVYDENYEQKHINTFLYRLRGADQNVDARHQTFSQLFPGRELHAHVKKMEKNARVPFVPLQTYYRGGTEQNCAL